MPIFIARIVFIFVSLFILAESQTFADAPNRAEHMISSQHLHEQRPVLVSLPDGYSDSAKSYPVLYVLNSPDNFAWASYIEDVLQSKKEIHELIVVGLPGTGNYHGDNAPFQNSGSQELSEGVLNHEAFIRGEAVPFVEQRYRTSGSKFIIGHSLAGLFVSHLFAQDPDGFNAHLAISPSFQYGPQMIDILKETFRRNPGTKGMLYMALGDLEHSLIRQPFLKMKALFERHAPDGLYWQIGWLGNTEHMGAGFSGILASLSWLYGQESLTDRMIESMTVSKVIQHYEDLSDRMGYTIKPRRRMLAGMRGFVERRLNKPKSGEKLAQLLLHYYPDLKQN